jgi:hypothetical protein
MWRADEDLEEKGLVELRLFRKGTLTCIGVTGSVRHDNRSRDRGAWAAEGPCSFAAW